VVLAGLGADVELARDFLGGQAFCEEVEHLAFARGELSVGVAEIAFGMLQLFG